MKNPPCFQYLLVSILLCLFALGAQKALAQENSLCFDLQFLPTKKIKKPKDTTCVLIENGFMYKKAEEIIKLSGLPMNFVVCRTNGVQNSFAALDKYGNRYIKYDDVFMKRLNSDSSALESMIILAHEIGHHIFFHTILSGTNNMALNYQQYGVPGTANYDAQKYKQAEEDFYEVRRRQELEADRFAGFIMARKGIKLDQVTRFYKKLEKYYTEKNESTHPAIDKRIGAVQEGFAEVDSTKSREPKPINLSKIGKEKVEYVFNNTNKIERSRLLKKIQSNGVLMAAAFIKDKQENLFFGISQWPIEALEPKVKTAVKAYLNKEFILHSGGVDDEEDYFEVYQVSFMIPDLKITKTGYYYAFHLKAGYFQVVLYDNAQGFEVAYKSRFAEDQISTEEIKFLFIRVLKKEAQEFLDNNLK
jgi:hypothetical protein